MPSTSNVSTDVWKGSGSAIKYLNCIELKKNLRGEIKSKEPNTSSRWIYGVPTLTSLFGKSQIEQYHNSLHSKNRNNSKKSRCRRRNRRATTKRKLLLLLLETKNHFYFCKNIRIKIDNVRNSYKASESTTRLFSNLTKRAVTVADLWNNASNINGKLVDFLGFQSNMLQIFANRLLEFPQNSVESCAHKPCYAFYKRWCWWQQL